MISQYRSKHSCKFSGYNKHHHTPLNPETLTKNSVTLTKNDLNTQTLNRGNAPPNTASLPPNTANSGKSRSKCQVSIIKMSLIILAM